MKKGWLRIEIDIRERIEMERKGIAIKIIILLKKTSINWSRFYNVTIIYLTKLHRQQN